MEHAVRGTPPGRTGSEGPRWRTLAWEVFVGYAFALAFLALVAVAVTWLGIAGREGVMAYRPEGVRQFPFVANGGWSLAANLFWFAAAGGVCALAVWACLRARWLALDLRTLGCRPRRDGWIVRRVLVDYELFGRRWTQPVPLIPAPALECGGVHAP